MDILAPSLLSADFSRLGEQIQAVKDGGAQAVHFDVMDGHFVKEISFGEPVLRSVRKMTDLTLDAHLMVYNPEAHVKAFAEAGADIFTFHFEAMPGGSFAYGGIDDAQMVEEDLIRLVNKIHACGMKAGVSIKPRTPVSALEQFLPYVELVLVMSVEPGFGGQAFIPESLERIRSLRNMADRINPLIRIEVDGGIKLSNVGEVLDAGADMIVAGSAVLGGDDVEEKSRAFMKILRQA